jgi:hypothetical protein
MPFGLPVVWPVRFWRCFVPGETTDPVRDQTLVEKNGWLFYRAVGTKPITKRGDAVWAPGGVVGTVLAMFCSWRNDRSG